MKESKIFTKGELRAIEDRKKGKLDKTGIFSRRVKPKIKEISEIWAPEIKNLEFLIKRKYD